MSLRVNNNIQAINAHRNMQSINQNTSRNLERLSSGLRVNNGSDSPASLVVSENMRAQITGVNQAIENTESGVSMIQVAEGALGEVNKLLNNMRQLAVHASNAGVNDDAMLAADQAELENSLSSIDRIAANTQFGRKTLLDGSNGANGVANGQNLKFISASSKTKDSGIGGFKVEIEKVATQANLVGDKALTQSIIDAGETLSITEGGRTIQFTTKKGDSVESTLNRLRLELEKTGMNVELVPQEEVKTVAQQDADALDQQDPGAINQQQASAIDQSDGIIRLRHKEFGSKVTFSASSSTAGILSMEANGASSSTKGLDIKGKINGEEAVGKGQILEGRSGNPTTDGLKVRYIGDQASASVGSVTVAQNSLRFQVGANEGQIATVSLRDMSTDTLGRGLATKTKVKSLEDVDLTSFEGAQDAIAVIDKAITETSTTRGELGAFQRNTLESNISTLRISSENLTAAESVIRDADMAKEMSSFTRNQILTQSAMATLAHSNSSARNVISLLQM